MDNLLKMGKPSAVVEHAERGRCEIGRCANWSEYSIVFSTETVELCHRHEELRKKGKTR